jgi:alpha-tubulin suppressor-like RCC1 family protein
MSSRSVRALLALVALATALVGLAPPAGAGGDPHLTGLAGVDIGDVHACARTTDGRVWCWGRNNTGQLGDGDAPNDSDVPVRVLGPNGTTPLTAVTGLSVNQSHSCVVLSNHQARCWGDNSAGQLGDGTEDPREHAVVVRNPTDTGPLTGVAQISAGGNHTCAVLTNGQVRCWGSGTFGQLGNGADDEFHLPRRVLALAGTGPLTGAATVSSAGANTCVVLRNHEARCWGQNSDHELGSAFGGDFAYRPKRVLNATGTAPLANVRAIAAGGQFACASLLNGQARCWGKDSVGSLGNGPDGDQPFPRAVLDVDGVGPLTGATRIAAGQYHACAVVTGRELRCWGDNFNGDLGNNQANVSSQLPVVVLNTVGQPRLRTVTQIGLGGSHSCARLANGEARCWGGNSFRELGNHFNVPYEEHPVPVLAPL